MSEAERRRTYTESRVLMSSVAVLNPTFSDGALYFTGAQVEIMRNLVQYANRIESYVAEYESGYYLTPDNDDWDDIQAIVADLEETLMGNPNTLWGYNDRIEQYEYEGDADVGENILVLDDVPANTVYVITDIYAMHAITGCTAIELDSRIGTGNYPLLKVSPVANYQPYNWAGFHVMKAGDNLRAVFYACTATDTLFLKARGYSMLVP